MSYMDVAYETFHVYPYGEENATTYVREAKDTDQVLLDNDYVKITLVNIDDTDDDYYYLNTYVENKSDQKLRISGGADISVNGYMVEGFNLAVGLETGESAYDSIWIRQDSLTENGIENVENIEFPIFVENSESYDILSEDTITVTVE